MKYVEVDNFEILLEMKFVRKEYKLYNSVIFKSFPGTRFK